MREICARPARSGELLVMRRSGFEFSRSPLQTAKVRSGTSVSARRADLARRLPARIRAGSRRWLDGLGLVPSVACGPAGDGDLQDLAEPGGGAAEAEVGHI